MKKLFIILYAIIIVACSERDIGGYTSPIIKNAKQFNLNASKENIRGQSLKKTALPIDENFSSMDKETLRNNLLNYYPKPKPEGDAEPIFSDGSSELGHLSYDGEIKKYTWKSTIPNIEEHPDYQYGFDKDPTEKDPVIYISVKETENVLFKFFLPTVSYNTYYLLDKKYSDNITKNIKLYGKELSNNTSCGLGYSSSSGNTSNSNSAYIDYTLCYSSSSNASPLTNSYEDEVYGIYGCLPEKKGVTLCSQSKQIHIKRYDEKIKNIIYIQLDGSESDLWETDETDTECNNGFTENCFRKYFKLAFNQAVVSANVYNATKKYSSVDGVPVYDGGIPVYDFWGKLITINMTNPDKSNAAFNQLKDKALALLAEQKAKDGKNWHVFFGFNKVRKMWDLDKCINSGFPGDLSKCYRFEPENENKKTTYKMYSPDDCIDGIDSKMGKPQNEHISVTIRAKEEEEKGIMKMHYYAYIGNQKAPYTNCDVLFTDNGYPIIPHTKNILGGTYAMNYYDINSLNKSYTPEETITFVPRGIGESSQYTSMHELGHAFGLTDVSSSYILGTVGYIESNSDFPYPYIKYATSETNIMSWEMPMGKKFRYRSTPIACTGGTKFYNKTSSGSTSLIAAAGLELKGKGENQWECIRDCHNSDDYAFDERKYFWKNEGLCNEKNKKKYNDPLTTYDKMVKYWKKILLNPNDIFSIDP